MCVLLPQVATEVRREEAIDEGIGGGIERRQTLDEGRNGRHRLGLGDVAVDLQQVEDDVRRPAQDEYCQLQCTHVDERDFHQSLIQISDCFPPESLGQKVVTFAQIVLRPMNLPKTMTNVILTVLILALGIIPRELARRLSWSSSSIGAPIRPSLLAPALHPAGWDPKDEEQIENK